MSKRKESKREKCQKKKSTMQERQIEEGGELSE
jgi:hypothetical protein